MIRCPKCDYVRLTEEAAPDWQCPACGVAYEKARQQQREESMALLPPPSPTGLPWGRLLAIAAIAWGAWLGLQRWPRERAEVDISSVAATAQQGEVLMYTWTHCPYCRMARDWLNANRIPFTECDAEARADCAARLEALGGRGVPYFVIRGQHMEGFDRDELQAMLARR